MNKTLAFLCAAAILAGCSTSSKNGGPTVFQGRFIGYNGEFVEFFIPQGNDFLEIPLQVNPDGTFCDTIQFSENLYDAALFADKFMFRISVEQGKTYNTEFDITEEGVETNFRFIGEGAAENEYMKHLWALDDMASLKGVSNFKEFSAHVKDIYAPLREELKSLSNKPFVKFQNNELDTRETRSTYYFPFIAADATGDYPGDPDFAKYIAGRKKMSDEEFKSKMEFLCTNVPYLMDGIDVTGALKAAASCTDKPELKEWIMNRMLHAMVGAGKMNGLSEGYDYFAENVKNEEFLDAAYKLCNNALLLAPGANAPDIEYEDVDGKVHHLSDYAGKPLYVDLWASWCGPCVEEIPYMASFVESLGKDPEIVCISISIDDVRSDWTAKLDEDKPGWPQFLATKAGQASISSQYFVTAIPRFLLITADGTIASVDAPRPSTPNLLNELKSLL